MTTARLNGLYDPQFIASGLQEFRVGTLAPGMDPGGREVTIMDGPALQASESCSEAEFDVEGLVWIDFWRTTNMSGPLEHMPLAL
ncbi:MAG: hypothetical protein V4499_00340 [Pseudomonadota bacterium]|jgi:hypothetical protein